MQMGRIQRSLLTWLLGSLTAAKCQSSVRQSRQRSPLKRSLSLKLLARLKVCLKVHKVLLNCQERKCRKECPRALHRLCLKLHQVWLAVVWLSYLFGMTCLTMHPAALLRLLKESLFAAQAVNLFLIMIVLVRLKLVLE